MVETGNLEEYLGAKMLENGSYAAVNPEMADKLVDFLQAFGEGLEVEPGTPLAAVEYPEDASHSDGKLYINREEIWPVTAASIPVLERASSDYGGFDFESKAGRAQEVKNPRIYAEYLNALDFDTELVGTEEIKEVVDELAEEEWEVEMELITGEKYDDWRTDRREDDLR